MTAHNNPYKAGVLYYCGCSFKPDSETDVLVCTRWRIRIALDRHDVNPPFTLDIPIPQEYTPIFIYAQDLGRLDIFIQEHAWGPEFHCLLWASICKRGARKANVYTLRVCKTRLVSLPWIWNIYRCLSFKMPCNYWRNYVDDCGNNCLVKPRASLSVCSCLSPVIYLASIQNGFS